MTTIRNEERSGRNVLTKESGLTIIDSELSTSSSAIGSGGHLLSKTDVTEIRDSHLHGTHVLEHATDVVIEDSNLSGGWILKQDTPYQSQDSSEISRSTVDASRSILTKSQDALVRDCIGDDYLHGKYVLHKSHDAVIYNTDMSGTHVLEESDGALVIDSILEGGHILEGATNATLINMKTNYTEHFFKDEDVEVYEGVPKRFARQLVNDPSERMKVPGNIDDKYRAR